MTMMTPSSGRDLSSFPYTADASEPALELTMPRSQGLPPPSSAHFRLAASRLGLKIG